MTLVQPVRCGSFFTVGVVILEHRLSDQKADVENSSKERLFPAKLGLSLPPPLLPYPTRAVPQ